MKVKKWLRMLRKTGEHRKMEPSANWKIEFDDVAEEYSKIPVFFFGEREVIGSPVLDVGLGGSYMRNRLTENLGNLGIYTSEVDLDVERFEYGDGFFKSVTSFEVIEHLYNPLFHLQEVHRVLRDSGTLYLTTPNDYSLIYKAEHLLSRKYRPHFHQFSERDLRDILEQAGFEVQRLKKFFRSNTGTLARICRNGLYVKARKRLRFHSEME